MSTINVYTVYRNKIGKGYFYLFKQSDFESVLSGITDQPIYLRLYYSMRPIIKTDTQQLKGEWFLGSCDSGTQLPYQFPDPKAKLINISTCSLPHRLLVDQQIDRQILKQICLDHMRPFFEKALKLDHLLITMTLLLESKTVSIRTELGSKTSEITVEIK